MTQPESFALLSTGVVAISLYVSVKTRPRRIHARRLFETRRVYVAWYHDGRRHTAITPGYWRIGRLVISHNYRQNV